MEEWGPWGVFEWGSIQSREAQCTLDWLFAIKDSQPAGPGVWFTSWGCSLRHWETSGQAQDGTRVGGSAVTLTTPRALWHGGRTSELTRQQGGAPLSRLPCWTHVPLTLQHSTPAQAGQRMILWLAFFHNVYSIFVGQHNKIPRRK